MAPKAAIVIRAKNEARYIGETLQAVFRQDEQDFEVIVIDSGSTDNTCHIVKQYDASLLHIKPQDFTYGRAINMGISRSTSEFVVSLSAHALPASRSWLSNLLRNFADPLVAGVYSRHIPKDNVTPLELFGMHVSGIMKKTPRRQTNNVVYCFSLVSAAIRRKLWQRFPFNENLTGCEDLVWGKQMQRLGYVIVYEPEAAVYHSHGESFWRLLRRQWIDKPVMLRLWLGLGSSNTRAGSQIPTLIDPSWLGLSHHNPASKDQVPRIDVIEE